MAWLVYLLSALYLTAAVWLAVYGFNSLTLTLLFLHVRRRPNPSPGAGPLPRVTVQLPIYNERWVVRRLLEAAARLDYPRELLQLQVLDDSVDDTRAIVDALVERWRRRGLDISVIRRQQRRGFKAGALANALPLATGELIAIFDADFSPPRDWLLRVVPHFAGRPRLGFVQTRWGHLNGVYSGPTRAQVLALDGHFIVEQTARQRSGLLMNFNGTAGIWRRTCVENAGGWSQRTLCEDLDLSYRAQMAGWQSLYLPDVVAPAEVPPTVSSFKRQQRRWATGSTQCLRHLAAPLLRSRLRWWQKLGGLVHLSGYCGHPLLLLLLIISLPMLFVDGGMRFQTAFLGVASIGPPLLYSVSQMVQGRKGTRRLVYLPLLVLLGGGLALSNTLAVLRGLSGGSGSFERTPKFRLVGAGGDWRGKSYALGFDATALGEVALAFYALVGAGVAWHEGRVYAVPFFGLYLLGFAYVAFEGLREGRAARAQAKRAPTLSSQASGSPTL